MTKRMKRVIVAIYTDPDFYPPTINAILNFASVFQEVVVVSRNNNQKDFPYPSNVHLQKVGPYCTVREMEKQSLWQKSFYFLQFTLKIWKYAGSAKGELVVLYDHFALFAYYLVHRSLRTKKVWYHNHDMSDKTQMSRYSIGGLAAKYEYAGLQKADFFSLPSVERLVYFPQINSTTQVFIIPNYPSLKVYNSHAAKQSTDNSVRIIFQGFIGAGHSLEEIIQLLPETINGFQLVLTLKGSVTDDYKRKLNKLAGDLKVQHQLFWIGVGPYVELPSITASSEVGIAINRNVDLVSLAQGTASNKIYEYAACGLPAILYKSGQFEKYLKQYSWAYFTDGTLPSLRKTLKEVISDIAQTKKQARKDFEETLNFENVFLPVLDIVTASFQDHPEFIA